MAGDEYVIDTAVVRDFIGGVRAAIAAAGSPSEACEPIRPGFASLLADPGWLPPASAAPGRPGADRAAGARARVRTTSQGTPVSIHLLEGDTGSVWRHAYDPDAGEARPFRSGSVDVACDEPPSRDA